MGRAPVHADLRRGGGSCGLSFIAFLIVFFFKWLSERSTRAFCASKTPEIPVELHLTEAKVGPLTYSWDGAVDVAFAVDKSVFPAVFKIRGQHLRSRRGERFRFDWHVPITASRVPQIEELEDS